MTSREASLYDKRQDKMKSRNRSVLQSKMMMVVLFTKCKNVSRIIVFLSLSTVHAWKEEKKRMV